MLLQRVEKFIKERRMPPTRFGRDALRDPCFVFDLRDGREPRVATTKRVLDYLEREERLDPVTCVKCTR